MAPGKHFDPAKHKRKGKGQKGGGQFTNKGSGAATVDGVELNNNPDSEAPSGSIELDTVDDANVMVKASVEFNRKRMPNARVVVEKTGPNTFKASGPQDMIKLFLSEYYTEGDNTPGNSADDLIADFFEKSEG
jgi:hypothetical protein